MMQGIVDRNCEATIRLVVGNVDSQRQMIDAVIDTGFTGFLTLPSSVLADLNLRAYRHKKGILGDGSTCVFDGQKAWFVTIIKENVRFSVLFMPQQPTYGPHNPHPLSTLWTEPVWEGKYDEYGHRWEADIARCAMPMQKIESIDEPQRAAAATGQLELFEQQNPKQDDFRNWLVMRAKLGFSSWGLAIK